MKKVYCKHFPRKGFTATTIWPWVFIRKDRAGHFFAAAERHERIHAHQQVEMLIVGTVLAVMSAVLFKCGWWSLLWLPLFFLEYALEWLLRFLVGGIRQLMRGRWCWNPLAAYYNLATEREAYTYQRIPGYLDDRTSFYWLRYLWQQW